MYQSSANDIAIKFGNLAHYYNTAPSGSGEKHC